MALSTDDEFEAEVAAAFADTWRHCWPFFGAGLHRVPTEKAEARRRAADLSRLVVTLAIRGDKFLRTRPTPALAVTVLREVLAGYMLISWEREWLVDEERAPEFVFPQEGSVAAMAQAMGLASWCARYSLDVDLDGAAGGGPAGDLTVEYATAGEGTSAAPRLSELLADALDPLVLGSIADGADRLLAAIDKHNKTVLAALGTERLRVWLVDHGPYWRDSACREFLAYRYYSFAYAQYANAVETIAGTALGQVIAANWYIIGSCTSSHDVLSIPMIDDRFLFDFISNEDVGVADFLSLARTQPAADA